MRPKWPVAKSVTQRGKLRKIRTASSRRSLAENVNERETTNLPGNAIPTCHIWLGLGSITTVLRKGWDTVRGISEIEIRAYIGIVSREKYTEKHREEEKMAWKRQVRDYLPIYSPMAQWEIENIFFNASLVKAFQVVISYYM